MFSLKLGQRANTHFAVRPHELSKNYGMPCYSYGIPKFLDNSCGQTAISLFNKICLCASLRGCASSNLARPKVHKAARWNVEKSLSLILHGDWHILARWATTARLLLLLLVKCAWRFVDCWLLECMCAERAGACRLLFAPAAAAAFWIRKSRRLRHKRGKKGGSRRPRPAPRALYQATPPLNNQTSLHFVNISMPSQHALQLFWNINILILRRNILSI